MLYASTFIDQTTALSRLLNVINSTRTICRKNSDKLWQKVIDCHRPIDDDVSHSTFTN